MSADENRSKPPRQLPKLAEQIEGLPMERYKLQVDLRQDHRRWDQGDISQNDRF